MTTIPDDDTASPAALRAELEAAWHQNNLLRVELEAAHRAVRTAEAYGEERGRDVLEARHAADLLVAELHRTQAALTEAVRLADVRFTLLEEANVELHRLHRRAVS